MAKSSYLPGSKCNVTIIMVSDVFAKKFINQLSQGNKKYCLGDLSREGGTC